jgi:hypothetical protein
MGLEALNPLEAARKLCLLVSCLGCEPVEGIASRGMPQERCRRAPSHR